MPIAVDATIMHDTLATDLKACEAFLTEGSRIQVGARVEIFDVQSNRKWKATTVGVRTVKGGNTVASLAFGCAMQRRPPPGSMVVAV